MKLWEIIKSSENRGVLLKGTTGKITSQEGDFLNFFRPLMKNVLTASAADAVFKKTFMDQARHHLQFQMKKSKI